MRGRPALLAAVTLTAATLASGCAAASGAAAGGNGGSALGAGSSPAAVSATAAPTAGGSPGTSAASGPITRSVPVRLRIPSIGVDTPVVPLGLAADGTVQVPPIEAHSPAGWYRGSPTPGQTGPSVILGHVTVGRYGNGVFLRLARLRPGARVLVRLRDGVSAVFRVDAVRTVPKDRFPTQEVYGDVDHPELRLITCGGPRTSRGYPDNVVVFASLTGTAG